MRFLFTADVHCHAWTQFSTRLSNGRNSRLEDCLSVFRQAAKIAVEKQIDRFFVLGDLFESRTKIDIDVFYATWCAIRDLTKVVPVTMLLGNHDQVSKVGDSNSVEHFTTICEVVNKPTVQKYGDAAVALYPWYHNTASLIESWKQLPQCDLLCIHQGMREASVGPYNMTGHGGVSVADLPLDRVRYVFAGDYHKRQFFGPGGRVHYIGSPCQLTFGEAGEDKAMTLLDTTTGNLETIPTDSPRFFKCSSAEDYSARVQSGEIRSGVDFVRIECSADQYDDAYAVGRDVPTVQVEVVKATTSALVRADRGVLDSDVHLLSEYLRQRSRVSTRLLNLGCELLCVE